MASAEDYTGLITSEHQDKPKYMEMIGLFAQNFSNQVNLIQSMVFDLDTALDVMLDYIGQWIGFSRIVATPLNIYFSFDISGLGFDQGIWFAPFDPVDGTTILDNDSYRRLLKARVGINHWDSTVIDFNAIMAKVFEGTGVTAYAIDNVDKTVTVHVSGNVPLVLKSLLDSGVMIPRPAGIVATVTYV